MEAGGPLALLPVRLPRLDGAPAPSITRRSGSCAASRVGNPEIFSQAMGSMFAVRQDSDLRVRPFRTLAIQPLWRSFLATRCRSDHIKHDQTAQNHSNDGKCNSDSLLCHLTSPASQRVNEPQFLCVVHGLAMSAHHPWPTIIAHALCDLPDGLGLFEMDVGKSMSPHGFA